MVWIWRFNYTGQTSVYPHPVLSLFAFIHVCRFYTHSFYNSYGQLTCESYEVP